VRKIPELLEEMARLLDEPTGTLRSKAMILRKHGLLSSEGRNRIAKIKPRDISNLLIATLGGGDSTKAHITVSSLRSAEFCRVINPERQYPNFTAYIEWPGVPSKELSPTGMLSGLKREMNFGEALDFVIEKSLEQMNGEEPPHSDVISVSVRRNRHMLFATIEVAEEAGEREIWKIPYAKWHHEFGVDNQSTGIKADDENNHGLGYRSQTEEVNGVILCAIAAFLSGRKFSLVADPKPRSGTT